MGLVKKVLTTGMYTYGVGAIGAAVGVGIKVAYATDVPYDDGFNIFAGIIAGFFSSAVLLSPFGFVAFMEKGGGGGSSCESDYQRSISIRNHDHHPGSSFPSTSYYNMDD